MTGCRVLADVVVLTHAAYVCFAVGGLAAVLVGRARGWRWVRNFWFRVVHLAAIALVVAQAWFGRTCPLTTLENYLRQQAGQATYPGDFIGYWVHELLFWDAPPWVFTCCYSLFGLAVAAALVLVPPQAPWQVSNRGGGD